MNTLPVTQIFAQVNTYRTPSSRDAERAMIAEAMSRYAGPVEQLPGYHATPLPPRRRQIDPETKLQRARIQKDDPRILEAIKTMPAHSAAHIARHLAKMGIKVQARDVDRIAALSSYSLTRACE